MKKLYHGTSIEAARNIVKNGFDHLGETIWSCSDWNVLYVRNSEEFAYDDYESPETEAIRECIYSGQIAAAMTDSKETKIAVLEFLVPDEIFESEFEEDDSCENMDGCYEISKDVLQELINDNAIQMNVLVSDDAYIPYLRVFYLSSVVNNRNMDIYDETLENICKEINKKNIYLDEIYEFSAPVAAAI